MAHQARGANPGRWRLPPVIWSPAAVILIAVAVGLGIAFVSKSTHLKVLTATCDVSEPGCALRQQQHWHADFALFVRGEQFDLGQDRFISTEKRELSDAAHIHDPRHNVVHIHLEATTWEEFLATLGFALEGPPIAGGEGEFSLQIPDGDLLRPDGAEKFTFIANGVAVTSIVGLQMGEMDRVAIVFGDETPEEAMAHYQKLPDEACIPSLLCRDRLPPGGLEDEPCTRGSECN